MSFSSGPQWNWTWKSLPRWRFPWQEWRGHTLCYRFSVGGALCQSLPCTLAVVLWFHTVNSQGCVICSFPQRRTKGSHRGSKVMAERGSFGLKGRRFLSIWGNAWCGVCWDLLLGGRQVSLRQSHMQTFATGWKSVISHCHQGVGWQRWSWPHSCILRTTTPMLTGRWRNLLQQCAKENKWRDKRLIGTKKLVVRNVVLNGNKVWRS